MRYVICPVLLASHCTVARGETPFARRSTRHDFETCMTDQPRFLKEAEPRVEVPFNPPDGTWLDEGVPVDARPAAESLFEIQPSDEELFLRPDGKLPFEIKNRRMPPVNMLATVWLARAW